MHLIKKSLGPFIFTLLLLIFVNIFFELNFSFVQSFKSAADCVLGHSLLARSEKVTVKAAVLFSLFLLLNY